MKKDGINLAFKITNWCNLNCAHCIERSSCKEPFDLLPLPKMHKIIKEFKNLDVNQSDFVVITGGESMAPYYNNQQNYIKQALRYIYKAGYVPVIKTNAVWGTDIKLRQKILFDLAESAYKYRKVVTLDISIDEFHNNLSGAANIITNVVSSSKYLSPAIRLCLAGFSSQASAEKLLILQTMLKSNNLIIIPENEISFAAYYVPNDINNSIGARIYTNFITQLAKVGRAKDNNLPAIEMNKDSYSSISCLQIDNKDVATFGYMWQENMNNKTLKSVLSNLIEKTKE